MTAAQAYDVVVVGIGSMGSAAVDALSRRGLKVLGLERFGPAHDRGSAHGGSRIVRQSYFESPAYVPLLQAAYDGWHSLEERSGRDILTLCGGLYLGDPESPVVTGSRASAQIHGLDHEVLDAAEIHRRFPALTPSDHVLGVYEANAGFVRPEETVLAGVELARRAGADLRFHEPVTSWSATPGGGVEVVTPQGRYAADRLVLTPGAWAPDLFDQASHLAVERQIFYWFAPRYSAEIPYERWAGLPVWVEHTDGQREIYGFPASDGPDGGVKLAFYRQNVGTTTPQDVDRVVHDDEVAAMRTRAESLLPGLIGPLLRAKTCLYASAPDDDFVIGPLPDAPQVITAYGFSGHGFKFVPVVGEIAADLVEHGTTDHPIDLFDPLRPALHGGAGRPRVHG